MGRKSKRAVAEGRLTSEGQTVMSQQAVFLKSVKSAILLVKEMKNLRIWQERRNLMSYQNGLFERKHLSEVCVLILFCILISSAAFLVLGLSILTTYGVHTIASLEAWSLALLVLFIVLFIVIVLIIWRQPQNQHKVAFMVCVMRIRDAKYYAHFLLYVSFCELSL